MVENKNHTKELEHLPEVDPTENEDPTVIQDKNRDFLQKVMTRAGLADPFDARDLTELVYRIMRDLMTDDTIERVEDELHTEASESKRKALQMEIAELWKDTNPIVGLISKIRQPLRGPAPEGIDDNLFIRRVANEGGIPPTVEAEDVIKAVFSATKEELSEERIGEVSGCLPGKIRQLWEQA